MGLPTDVSGLDTDVEKQVFSLYVMEHNACPIFDAKITGKKY